MARHPVVLATVCAIGGAVVAALFMARGRDADDAQMAALQRRLDTLESRATLPQATSDTPATVALRDQALIKPVKRDQAQKLSNPSAGAISDDQAAPPFMDPAALAERRRYAAGVLEQTMAAQQIDVAGSNTFAAGLTQALGEDPELAGNQLINAQCRATLCRIAVLQRSDEDVESFLGQIGTLPGFENTETHWQRQLNADGSGVMTMYIARPGHKLPDYEMPTQGLANR